MQLSDIITKIYELCQQKKSFWVATLTKSDGSVPGVVGMKMIVLEDGSIFGTIGGGMIEKTVIQKIIKYKPKTLQNWKFALSNDIVEDAENTGMLCGGAQEVIIEPVNLNSKLYIFGAGHCGIALSYLAAKCGFDVFVIDNRDDWLTKEKHPLVAGLIKMKLEEIDKSYICDDSYAVIMTYAHTYDEIILKQLLNFNLKYLGLIGSSKKITSIFENMINEGYSKEKLLNVYAPVGLNLKTHTPDEIAVSIMAQILAVKNGINEIPINNNPLLNNETSSIKEWEEL
ncbi:MAG TPA: XdhC/CoxI family protein [Ignavibacteriales bacterium]|nr:XdhC/CoxI family protein [Ignavibacteriales bacterium]HOL80779.1 XdhC/CoxI family protein [Ignavibacteriales bacterium]HOM66206.1 XdhC/CoxI family protein [Ignavibacteriales bacterium]HPP33215.1 XdhC/CoxI family protein [Ignavibacteriales bacterium]HRR17890.1 XdhC/CoxI family protein [Ignavibacteriales bacterium]